MTKGRDANSLRFSCVGLGRTVSSMSCGPAQPANPQRGFNVME